MSVQKRGKGVTEGKNNKKNKIKRKKILYK